MTGWVSTLHPADICPVCFIGDFIQRQNSLCLIILFVGYLQLTDPFISIEKVIKFASQEGLHRPDDEPLIDVALACTYSVKVGY